MQEQGDMATRISLGANQVTGLHSAYFDFDEEALSYGVELLVNLVLKLASMEIMN
jgi:aminobenzoyl-glutamate utilization protein A